MRERSKIIEDVSYDWISQVFANDIWQYDITNVSTNLHDAVMHDVETAGYHVLSKKGSIINSPMDRLETMHVEYPTNRNYTMGISRTDGNTTYYARPTLWPHLALPSVPLDAMLSLAVTKAWGNVSSSEAAALVEIGEGKKTIDGLTSMFRRLVRIIRQVKKLQFQKLKKELSPNELMDRWLEIRYGIRPLVYSTQDIVNGLLHVMKYKGSRQTFRGYELYEAQDSDVVTNTVTNRYQWDQTRTAMVRAEVRAGVLTELYRQVAPEVWGLLDAPQALWDLTTFSFVVDWFFNVGDIISAFTPSANWKALSSWTMSTVTSVQTIVVGDAHSHSVGCSCTLNGGMLRDTTIAKVRTPNPTRSIVPVFNVNLDASKLIDIVALSRIFYRTIPRGRGY